MYLKAGTMELEVSPGAFVYYKDEATGVVCYKEWEELTLAEQVDLEERCSMASSLIKPLV